MAGDLSLTRTLAVLVSAAAVTFLPYFVIGVLSRLRHHLYAWIAYTSLLISLIWFDIDELRLIALGIISPEGELSRNLLAVMIAEVVTRTFGLEEMAAILMILVATLGELLAPLKGRTTRLLTASAQYMLVICWGVCYVLLKGGAPVVLVASIPTVVLLFSMIASDRRFNLICERRPHSALPDPSHHD